MEQAFLKHFLLRHWGATSAVRTLGTTSPEKRKAHDWALEAFINNSCEPAQMQWLIDWDEENSSSPIEFVDKTWSSRPTKENEPWLTPSLSIGIPKALHYTTRGWTRIWLAFSKIGAQLWICLFSIWIEVICRYPKSDVPGFQGNRKYSGSRCSQQQQQSITILFIYDL